MRNSGTAKAAAGGGLILIVMALVGCVIVAGLVTSVRRLDPGEVGVIVDYGKGTTTGEPEIRSVQTASWTIINPMSERLVEYPASQRTLQMAKDSKEDDSVRCQDRDGVPMNLDVTITWRVAPASPGQLYLLRPNDNIEGIENGIVRREARAAVANACGTGPFGDVLAKREAFAIKVETALRVALEANFIQLDNLLIGESYLGPDQTKAIQAKSVAQEQAAQAQFLAAKAQAEADAARKTAEGARDVAILKAEGEARAIEIINVQLGRSPAYLDYLATQNWNGVLPSTLVGGGGTGVSIFVPSIGSSEPVGPPAPR